MNGSAGEAEQSDDLTTLCVEYKGGCNMAAEKRLALTGRIDSANVDRVEQAIREQLGGEHPDVLVLDAAELSYVSSAGLRLLLLLRREVPALRLVNVQEEVYEILEMTGFTGLMSVSRTDGTPAAADELVLPARTENLTAFQDFADERLGEDCPFRTKMQIELVVEEIFINIASYAYAPGEGDAAMQVERSEDPAAVTITFRDRGVPYDPLQREDPDVNAMAEARQIGGLGIFLTKQLMDEVRYEYTGGQNVLTMKKLLGGDETSAQ